MSIRNLEPKGLWESFYELTQIPRPSKKEEKVVAFLKQFGENLGLETIVDKVGNVIIRKPATPGYENRMGVVLQAHVDMVPQKNSDKVHDFEKDPIKLRVDGDYLYATDTTLGADNGIGVSYMLAMLDSDKIQGPELECIFTTQEETTMIGVKEIDENNNSNIYVFTLVFGGAAVDYNCSVPLRDIYGINKN